VKRRKFITLLGGAAAAWPIAARAQQPMPLVGYLTGFSVDESSSFTEAFRQGLGETGYTEGRSVTIEYRYANHRMGELRSLAAELIARKPAVIAAVGGNNTALVTRTLTSTIPIVFTSGLDPVKAGLVASLNRPEANVTGVSWFASELGHKHVEVLHEFLPQAALIALLVDPNNPESVFYEQNALDGARALGRRLFVLKAGTVREIDEAFARLVEQRANAVMVAGPFYATRAVQLAMLAARHGLPMIAAPRAFPVAGALIGYGNSTADAYRRAGVLTGRLLKGATPAETPVDRATKFEFVINLATARTLGIKVPPSLLARADEVIE
jgi:putative tryptophan/tyrosine transport system substrate-binding protein